MTFDHTPDVEWEPLFTQQLYAVVDREHPLATRGLVGFDELAEQPFVAPQPGSHAAQDIRRCVRPAWRDPDDCVRGNRHHHATGTHRGTIGRRYPPPRFDTFTRRRRNRRRRRPPGPTDRDRMDGEQISSALGRQFPRQRAGMATHTPSASRHRATGSAQTWL
jgi:DNA-binding transcriptional LysR family regulator